MSAERHSPPGRFSEVAEAYAGHRPGYPSQVAAALAALAPATRRAFDVGCGNGQLSRCLADRFEHVDATDISAAQIARAEPHPKVRYAVAPAERMAAEDGSIDLVTAAQAAHWFDLSAFYSEVRRVAAPDGILALISYGVPALAGPGQARFHTFYWHEIAPHWPAERHHVETGYAELAFPFAPLSAPKLAIRQNWDLRQVLGYVRTWTATRAAERAGRAGLVARFEADLAALWGAPTIKRQITWPIAMRIGRVNSCRV